MFSDRFKLNFTSVEQQSEMIRQVAAIGDVVEVALIEDIMGWLDQTTDITKMSEKSIRSLLAFFLTPVRSKTRSFGQAVVFIDVAETQVTIPAGTLLLAEDGTIFKQLNTVILLDGENAAIDLVQGQDVSVTGTYSGYIKLAVERVDLSTVVLSVASVEIPDVFKSDSGVVRPYAGKYVFYYDGYLYIKIYEGEAVQGFEGQAYVLTYAEVDGLSGNIKTNSLASYATTIYDSSLTVVQYHFTNPAFTGGAGDPLRYELVDLLRYWFYTKDSVSKISDYMNWFRTQPEVGDVIALGDYEKFLLTGILTQTGLVTVSLLNKEGLPISEGTEDILEERLSAVRDVGITEYEPAVMVEQIINLRLRSTEDFTIFQNIVNIVVANFYDLTYLRNRALSLFDPISATEILNAIMSETNLTYGLEMTASLFLQINVAPSTGVPSQVFFLGSIKFAETTYKFTAAGTGTVSLFKEQTKYVSNTVDIISQIDAVVGSHNYITGVVHFNNIAAMTPGGVLEITGLMIDQGNLIVGTTYGYRKLRELTYALY